MHAPIALFVYNRPWHTQQTVEALLKNELAEESELFIFSDAPKNIEAATAVQEVRDYIRTIKGFKSVAIVERENNFGLAASIIDGVTKLCNDYGRAVVVEDDLIVASGFLSYMNDALELYKDNAKVMQIAGYQFPVNIKSDQEAFFLPFTTSWGWATWKRAWECFDPSAKDYSLLKKDRRLRKAFDLGGTYPYFEMLESQLRGETDSWAIRWYLSVFMHQGLTLYPARTLVQNTGMDGSGTHCGKSSVQQLSIVDYDFDIKLPTRIEISGLKDQVIIALQVASRPGFINKLKGIFR